MAWQDLVEEVPVESTVNKLKDAAYSVAYKGRAIIDNIGNRRKANVLTPDQVQAEMDKRNEKDVENMPWGEQAMINAGRETSKLLTGAANFRDFLSDAMGDPLAQGRTLKRMQANEGENTLMKGFEEGADTTAKIAGGMLPYMLTGVGTGPMTAKLAEAGLKGLSDVGAFAATEGRGALAKTAQTLIDKGGKVGEYLGGRMQSEWVNPLMKAKQARMVRDASGAADLAKDPLIKGILPNVLGGTATGAVEGALHPDNSAAGGAVSSLIGGAGGAMVKPIVTRMPSYYTKAGQDLVSWAAGKGYKWLPGMETGNTAMQTFEAGMKNSKIAGDVVRRSDMANDQVTNHIVGTAMGMKNPADLGPAALGKHLDSLKAEYNDLTASTKSLITNKDIRKLDAHTRQVALRPHVDSNAAALALDNYKAWIMKASNGINQSKSRILPGDRYQEIRTALKADISNAAANGDWVKKKALQPVLDILDNGVDSAATKYNLKGTSAAWKDINERNAMTEMVIQNGSDPLGGADAIKLLNHFMASDPKRFLAEIGGDRLKELQKAAKVEALRGRVSGSSLTGLGLKHSGNTNQSLIQALMQTPAEMVVPPLTRTAMKLYEKGYMTTHPLRLSGKNFGDTVKLGRALQQQGQYYPEGFQSLQDIKDSLEKLTK